VLEALRAAPFDCVLLGPALSDMSAIELLRRIVESETVTEMRFVIYGTESLGGSEQQDLRKLAEVLVNEERADAHGHAGADHAVPCAMPCAAATHGPRADRATGGSAGAGEQKNSCWSTTTCATCSR